MYLFRALNSYDQLVDPVKNGIASKILIYNATKRFLLSTQGEKISSLSKRDQDLYVKEYMNTYLLEHKYKLSKIFRKDHNPVKNTIHHFVNNKDILSYCHIIIDLSTLPNHLVNGSKTFTNWISSTSTFDKMWSYYDSQDVHSVAVLDINTNGVFDENSYAVDVSNRQTIDKISFLSNKISSLSFDGFVSYMQENPNLKYSFVDTFHKNVMHQTDKKFMGFNFAVSSNEVSIYEYLPKESIISILESLQVDLICADLFNEEFLFLPSKKQAQELEKLKNNILRHILEENNPYMLYVFEELYLKNHNIINVSKSEEEVKRMTLTRNEIIRKSRSLPSILIKKI